VQFLKAFGWQPRGWTTKKKKKKTKRNKCTTNEIKCVWYGEGLCKREKGGFRLHTAINYSHIRVRMFKDLATERNASNTLVAEISYEIETICNNVSDVIARVVETTTPPNSSV